MSTSNIHHQHILSILYNIFPLLPLKTYDDHIFPHVFTSVRRSCSNQTIGSSLSEALTFTYPFSTLSTGDEMFIATMEDFDTASSPLTAEDNESLLCKPSRDRFFRRNTFPLFSTTSVIAQAHRSVRIRGGNIDQTGYFNCTEKNIKER